MRTFIALLFTAILLVSCSGKGAKSDVSIVLTLGNVASGVPLTGGVFLAGTNGAQKFSFGTANPGNVNIPLPNGNWTITALGWKAGSGPMDGINVCGKTTIDLQGGDAAVNLILSTDNCNSVPYADADSFDTGLNNGTFKQITFNSCLTTTGAGFSTVFSAGNPCANNDLDSMVGQSAAVRVIMRGESNFGAPVGDLSSACFKIDSHPTDLTGSTMTTSLRLPVNLGGTAPFAIELQGFRDVTCGTGPNAEGDGDQDGYIFLHGLGGAAGGEAHSEVFTASGSRNYVYWPDNYLGYPDSAFRTSGVAPILQCNSSQCFNGDDTLTDNFPSQNVKQGVWDIAGNPNWVNLHQEDSTANATVSLINGANTIIVTADTPGVVYEIQITSPGVGTAASATIDNSTNVITLSTEEGASTTTVKDALNGVAGVSATGTGAFTAWHAIGSYYRFNLPKAREEREYGLLHEVKHMLYGPLGAILHKHGIVDLTAVCAAANNGKLITENFVDEFGNNESISLHITDGLISPPTYMSPGTGNLPYEKRLTFTEPNGRGKMAFEFNCPGSPNLQGGWFRADWNEDGVEKMELHYSTTTAGKEAVEVVEYDNDSWGLRKSYMYFQNTNATGAWRYYEIAISPDHDHYARIAAAGDESTNKVDVRMYQDIDTIAPPDPAAVNTHTNFTGANQTFDSTPSTDCMFISTEAPATCGPPTVVEPTDTTIILDAADTAGLRYFVSPSVIPGLSTQDLDTLPTGFTPI